MSIKTIILSGQLAIQQLRDNKGDNYMAKGKRELRIENLESISISGLYPCGEGAGFAGGIVSAAVDGIKVAERIISKYKPL